MPNKTQVNSTSPYTFLAHLVFPLGYPIVYLIENQHNNLKRVLEKPQVEVFLKILFEECAQRWVFLVAWTEHALCSRPSYSRRAVYIPTAIGTNVMGSVACWTTIC